VTMESAAEVRLLPGFQAATGAVFRARVNP
jgi:hypothetical protein